MLGLKGKNMKLASKPPTQPKPKLGFQKLSTSSPYYRDCQDLESGTPTRRIQSATSCRNSPQTQVKSKSRSLLRKQSEPIIRCRESVSAQPIRTVQPRPPSSSAVSQAKRGSNSPVVSAEIGGRGDAWNLVRPLSAVSTISNSNKSDAFLPNIHSPKASHSDISTQLDFNTIGFEPEDKSGDNEFTPIQSPSSRNGDLLSSESDYIKHVVSFCDEIGLESSLIEDLRKGKRDQSCAPEQPESQTSQYLEENLKEPSLLIQSSFPMQEYSKISNSEIKEEFIREINKKVQNVSRSNSGASEYSFRATRTIRYQESPPSNSSSPEVQDQNQAITRIISTLRLIEDEEKKGCVMAAHFGEFFRQKLSPENGCCNSNPNTPPPTTTSRPSSVVSPFLDTAHSFPINDKGVNFQTGSGRYPSNCTTPKLPPIQSSQQMSPSSYSNGFLFPPQSSRSFFGEFCNESQTKVDYPNEHMMTPYFENNSNSQITTMPVSSYGNSQCFSTEMTDEKTRDIFSFLDEVEKSDRDVLFNLKFENSQHSGGVSSARCPRLGNLYNGAIPIEFPAPVMDTLIRKGSVELARELILLQRKVEEMSQNTNVLEETLMSQRELNVRNIKNSQRDLKKRLKIQQEEFELALSRHQTFVDQLIAEKRGLQDKCEKVLRESKESEERYQQQIKSLQDKHLDELKRIRKLQDNAEKTRKQKWIGSKTQEIRDMTVKGLEPEIQRIIQRHQQEMSEMRAWHADELRESEERYSRKQTMHLQELRDNFNREKEEACRRERELSQKRYDSDLSRLNDEFESHKRRMLQELQEERERFNMEESKLKEIMQENVRKAQIKGEVEMDTQKQEYESKIAGLERRYEGELKSLKDVYENQRESLLNSHTKKFEAAMAERESVLQEQFQLEKEKDIKEKEKKLRDEFKKLWSEEEESQDARIRRMQEKFQSELAEFEKSELELKQKFSQVKSEVLAKEELVFSLKTTLGLKEKQITELNESNMKMLEERINLTAVIRREFTAQIEALEEESRLVKTAVLELKAKQKLDTETHQMDLEKVRAEKDVELEKIGLRVKQALLRKEEAVQEFQKQLEKAQIRISHLEQLLEQQRKDFVSSITTSDTAILLTKKK